MYERMSCDKYSYELGGRGGVHFSQRVEQKNVVFSYGDLIYLVVSMLCSGVRLAAIAGG